MSSTVSASIFRLPESENAAWSSAKRRHVLALPVRSADGVDEAIDLSSRYEHVPERHISDGLTELATHETAAIVGSTDRKIDLLILQVGVIQPSARSVISKLEAVWRAAPKRPDDRQTARWL